MRFAARLRSWLRSVSRRPSVEQEMDSELRFHIETYREDLVRSGMSPEEAKRRARLEFGSVEASKDECRDALGLRAVYEVAADLRYAFRMLRQSPGFTAVAVLSLALGIGANTAIFTLMESALWKTIPVKNPEQLRLFSWVSGRHTVMDSLDGDVSFTPAGGTTSTSFSYAVFKAMQRENTTLQSISAFKPISHMTAVVHGQAQIIDGELVSGNYYESLGLVPIIGRPIIGPADDAKAGAGAVGVISDAFWSREFGRDPAAIGTKIELNQFPVTIVGVNPPSFHGMETGEHPDVFFPLSMQPLILPDDFAKNGSLLNDPDNWWLLIMGRLTPKVSEAKAQAALDLVLTQTVRNTLPNKRKRAQPRLQLATGSRGLDELRSQFRKPLLVLMALVGLVLLIACANLANLLLSRATARQREISVRLALGAGRWRIVRQLLTEGLLLAGIGGAAGVLAGYGLRNGIPRLLVDSWMPNPLEAQFDVPVLLLSIGLTLLAGILFSLAPAWQSARGEINAALKDGVRATMSLPKLVTGKALVIVQVCLSVLLLVGAGLFIRTLANLRSADLGFNPARVLLFTVDPPRTRYKGEQTVTLFERIQDKVAAIPGVKSASLSGVALVANNRSTTSVSPKGFGSPPEKTQAAWMNIVDPAFFHTMEIPILYGRAFNAHDRSNSPRVALVNQEFAQQFFPNTNALGKVFGNDTDYQIVGVCGNTKYNNIRSTVPPTFYLPYTQSPELGAMTFEVKTAAAQAGIVKAIREAVRAVDKDLPVSGVRTQTEQIDATISNERAFAALSASLGLLALVLAAVGIYGVIAYSVVRRTGEIGIRMALGAQSGQVLRTILRESLLLAAAGVVIGIVAAVGLTRYVTAMLYGLKPYDPVTIAGAVLVMLGVALFAAWWPARRASRLDPMAALRHE